MNRIRRTLIAVGLVVGVIAALAPAASAVVVHLPNGHFLGVSPHRGINPASIHGSFAARAQSLAPTGPGVLTYQGGPVVHSSAPYLIFWTPPGESVPASSEALLTRYFVDVAAASGQTSNVFGVGRQYTDSSGFADYQQTFAPASQVIVDTRPYPAPDVLTCTPTHVAAAYPNCITDAQLQSEVTRLIAARSLPTGVGANAPIYFVVTPADVNVCIDSSSCADNVFCAYHSDFIHAGTEVLYSSIPFFLNPAVPAQNPKACQHDSSTTTPIQEPNADLADVAVSYLSHEDNETLTDPLGTGWWDTTPGSGNENGDNCAAYGAFSPTTGRNPQAFAPVLGGSSGAGTLYDQVIATHPYYTQSEWSNGDVNCKTQPSPGAITPSFSVPPPGSTPVGAPLSLDPSAGTSTNQYSSESWDFGDGSPPAFNAGSTLVPVTHTYASAGRYTARLTLVDDRGNLATTTQQLSVGLPPRAAFTFSPARPVEHAGVRFDGTGSSDPDGGVTISSYAWNFGDGFASTGASPSHVYAHAGTYTVILSATNSVGATSTTTRLISVDDAPRPVIAFSPGRPASGQPVSFSGARSSDPDGAVVRYAWGFGDGSRATRAHPSHTYARPGIYVVALKVRDSAGRTATTTKVLSVALAGRVIKVVVHRHRGGATLLIRVNAPGLLSAGGKTVRVRRAGTTRFAIQPSGAQLTRRVRVRFRPVAGRASSRTVTVNFG